MNYYVARSGQQYGPYTEETVRSYIAAGSLQAADNIREETSQTWTTIGQQFNIAPAMAQPQAVPQYTQAPQYAQTPQYAQAPQYAQPGPYGQAAPGPQIVPPDMHWALVLILSITWVFAIIWAFVQSNYARKIDQGSSAIWGIGLWTILSVADFVMNYQAVMAGGTQAGPLGGLLGVAGIVCYIWAMFNIRKSMVSYYNSVEPIQLRLSGPMTFLFGIYYLQYHMSRIAKWKKTGILAT